MITTGTLYVISTPIGNLEDITLRALHILKEVDLIACEDTRHISKLLSHYQIKKPLVSYFEHNEIQRTTLLVKELEHGKKVGLASNAGTPLISDPGYELIKACIEKDIPIVPVPGVSALTTALSVSGLASDRFVFEGFLPRKTGKRKKRLAALATEPRTIIIYESPYRLLKTLSELHEHLGDRKITLARELTKFYEEVKRGRIPEIIQEWKDKKIKGEFTIVVEGHQARLNRG